MNQSLRPDPRRALEHLTRRKVLALLLERGTAMPTAALAVDLGLHPNGIRVHLRQLADAGLVEHTRTSAGRGRPGDRWTAAPGAQAHVEPQRTYEDLSRWLVGAIGCAPTALRNVEAAGLVAGHDLAVAITATGVDGLHQAIASLGFQPSVPKHTGNDVTFSLGNCPYRDAVRENPEVVCALHRGLTSGLLERLAPHAALTKFVPKNPDKVGCIISISGVTEAVSG